MKKTLMLVFILGLLGCGKESVTLMGASGKDGTNGTNGNSCFVQDTSTGAVIKCTDGSEVEISDGSDGTNGVDGIDGQDGQGCTVTKINSTTYLACGQDLVEIYDGTSAALLTTLTVEKNKCKQVDTDIYVENIRNGDLFDVYSDSKCRDRVGGQLGEFCDNVKTSQPNTGKLGTDIEGASEVCWVGNKQLSGSREQNGNITLRILDFN